MKDGGHTMSYRNQRVNNSSLKLKNSSSTQNLSISLNLLHWIHSTVIQVIDNFQREIWEENVFRA